MPLYPPPAAGRIPAYAKSTRTAGDLTNTSATPVLLPTVTLVSTGADVMLIMLANASHSAAGGVMLFNPRIDGAIPSGLSNARAYHTPNLAGGANFPAFTWVFTTPSAGSHTYGWDFSSATAGTQTVNGTAAQPLVVVAFELLT